MASFTRRSLYTKFCRTLEMSVRETYALMEPETVSETSEIRSTFTGLSNVQDFVVLISAGGGVIIVIPDNGTKWEQLVATRGHDVVTAEVESWERNVPRERHGYRICGGKRTVAWEPLEWRQSWRKRPPLDRCVADSKWSHFSFYFSATLPRKSWSCKTMCGLLLKAMCFVLISITATRNYGDK